MKRAFITGVTGQDGSYLTELLLAKGYHVFGLVRQVTREWHPLCLPALRANKNFMIIAGDMLDPDSLSNALQIAQPDEIYNLAALSFVGDSWSHPEAVVNVNALGLVRLLKAMMEICPKAHVYQASSSEQFGNGPAPQNEQTPFRPRSPYGASKVLAHNLACVYRESYGLHVSCGILFNHESPRRGEQFVTRKITKGIAEIVVGRKTQLELGNLSASRDWGFAGDYVRAMWLMLQQDKPGDYVIGTGETHTVREFAAAALSARGLWPFDHYVATRDELHRPAEVNLLRADASLARKVLGWEPTVDFDTLVRMMVDADLEAA